MSGSGDRLPSRSAASEVEAFLREVANRPKPAAGAARGRLIFALDATASRQPTWDRACELQGEMFLAAQAQGGLEVQLVYYRGFHECRASRWAADAAALVRLMTAVACQGGRTQIGRVLRHAVKETGKRKVNALVFVGDCLDEDADELGALAGELGLLGVPVFVFHEGGEPVAAAGFRRIAQVSGGAYCPFDAGSARQLRELLGGVAAYASGGRPALERYGARVGGEARKLAHVLALPGARRGPGPA
jgi:hypothetical protein